ncbi:hypothetical protein [Burkholderia multivorans]|uniref:hypothetical protein n=1 Tax=Burkholderia multivorans TaxID=87883 RepID=UPI0021C01064|nr:hypothetical protein [Burkholderia multivorans]
MANNNFKPFAAAAGANVMAQADYEALAALLTGFQSGTAQSAQLNKVWRQSSIMAAVLAQFIVDLTGQDAIDDGTTATLLANLKAAVSAQSIGVVGSARNARMIVSTPSATATFTADEVVVESALGGVTYRLANFSNTINLATTGAGGMNSGQAPASGYVAIYVIYNPVSGASALIAKDATAATMQSEVFSGPGMPSGYTASALVSVVRTNASRQFAGFFQSNRFIGFSGVGVFGTVSGGGNAFNPQSISGAVPYNAKSYAGYANCNTAGASAINLAVASTAEGYANQTANMNGATNGGCMTWTGIPLSVPQTAFFYYNATGATAQNYNFYISGYTF